MIPTDSLAYHSISATVTVKDSRHLGMTSFTAMTTQIPLLATREVFILGQEQAMREELYARRSS